jgi:hypothetical protein
LKNEIASAKAGIHAGPLPGGAVKSASRGSSKTRACRKDFSVSWQHCREQVEVIGEESSHSAAAGVGAGGVP